MSTEMGFVYVNGRISALETELIDRRMWQMLVSSQSREEAIRLLTDTWYHRFIEHHSLAGTFERALSTAEQELVDSSNHEQVRKAVLIRRDVRNARYIWKPALTGADDKEVALEAEGALSASLLREVVSEENDRTELPRLFEDALEDLLDLDSPSIREIERRMDRLAAEVELEGLAKISTETARYVRMKIELKNFLTAGRAKIMQLEPQEMKPMLLPGGFHSAQEIAAAYRTDRLASLLWGSIGCEKASAALDRSLSEGSFLDYERQADQEIMDILIEASSRVFGPAPLVSYLLLRELEITHLRILVAAKTAGVDKHRLLERLPRG